MLNDLNLGWLAGILDGEGSIYISVKPRQNFGPGISFTNSSLLLMEKVQDVLSAIGVQVVIGIDKAQTRRKSYKIYITTVEGMRTTLVALFPLLTSKKRQATLMLEFLSQRKGSARKRSDGRDFEIAGLISAINRGHFESVETVSNSRESAKIQSELHSDMESPAEMTGPTLVKTA